MRFTRLLMVAFLVACATRSADAQAVSVQLPRQDVFSVGTVVSVPDRGGVYLGGVKRAADSRSQYGFGPLRAGSSIGSERSASSLSAHVYIHDFDEMDRMLLNTPTGGGLAAMDRPLNGLAAHAHGQLVRQHTEQRVAGPSRSDGPDRGAPQLSGANASLRPRHPANPAMAERYRREAARASLRGQTETANLYLRLAKQCDGESDSVGQVSSLPVSSVSKAEAGSNLAPRDLSLNQRARQESE